MWPDRASAMLLRSNSSLCGDPMPLNIRSEETEELANALARLTGETKTEAVTQAIRARLQRLRRARTKRRLADDLDEIALHCSTLPVLDQRSADDIIGYDENGLPR
jgi:antitoxin VapB